MNANHRVAIAVLFGGAAAAAQAQSLVVVNQGNASVSSIDPATLAVTASIDQQQRGKMRVHEVAVSPDGKTAYLPVYGDSGVGLPGADGQKMLFLDMPSRKITGSIDFKKAVRPHLPIFDPNSGRLYVTTEVDNSVAIIDPKTRKIIGSIPTGAEQSHILALSSDGRRGYTANVGPGSVSVLDMKARKTLAVIPVTQGVQRIAIFSGRQAGLHCRYQIATAGGHRYRNTVGSHMDPIARTWLWCSGNERRAVAADRGARSQ